MSEQALVECLADVARQLSKRGAHELSSVVVSAGSAAALRQRIDGLATPPQQRSAQRLAAVWEGAGSVGADAIALALRSGQAAAEGERLAQTVELVWTGPKSLRVPVAMNAEALNELIDAVEHELLVVSYATFQVPDLVSRLGEAVARGVEVTLVLEFHGAHIDEPSTWDPVRGLGGTLPDGVEVYQWPIELREVSGSGRVGYLHAKCAVADQRIAFVSSANLTTYAMEMNMELGVVVRGGEVPPRIAQHFAALIDDGILQRVAR